VRMTSLAVLFALAGAACVRGARHLEPAPASLAAQSEFAYRRAHSSAGRFIAADVLSANGDRPLEEVLRERLLGFDNASSARPSPQNEKCGVNVYVNGLHSTLDGILPRDLLGVEYYEASNAPVKYRRAFSTCPVLLLWLKPSSEIL
jgi:hypothetical protein